MEKYLAKNDLLSLLQRSLFFLFLISLVFSFRAVNSISVGLIFLTGLLTNKKFISSLFQKKPVNFFIAGCLLFFLLQVVSLFYAQNQQQGWGEIRLKSGVILVPVAVYCSGYLNSKTTKQLLLFFCIILSIASLYCLIIAFLRYERSGNNSLFFYHALVSPLHQHAVYFSIYIFTGLVFLLESVRKKDASIKRAAYIFLSIYFSVFLFLLSSKLIIGFFIAYICWYFIWMIRKERKKDLISIGALGIIMLAGALVLVTHNPISKRFSEILNGNIALVEQERYSPADYFNGLQFRLLQWKLVPEILNKNKAWVFGVSSGDAQSYINEEYISKNMYTGDPVKKDHGFLGYNTHNQFLETLLQSGVTGLLVFIFICFEILKMAGAKKSTGAIFISLLLIVFSFTESVFETQFGIVIFTLFPLLVYFNEPNTRQGKELNV